MLRHKDWLAEHPAQIETELATGSACAHIRGTGLGMSAEEIAVALTPFGQVDARHSREREGAGLGLPIAKDLVELHGRRLEIRSAKALGTEVSEVCLPVPR